MEMIFLRILCDQSILFYKPIGGRNNDEIFFIIYWTFNFISLLFFINCLLYVKNGEFLPSFSIHGKIILFFENPGIEEKIIYVDKIFLR